MQVFENDRQDTSRGKYLHSVESFNLRMGIILCFNKNDKDKTRAMGEYVYEV